jgi:hypothetical protein
LKPRDPIPPAPDSAEAEFISGLDDAAKVILNDIKNPASGTMSDRVKAFECLSEWATFKNSLAASKAKSETPSKFSGLRDNVLESASKRN